MGTITGQLDTNAGTGTVQLTHVSFPDATIEVGEIGELSIEFDMRDVQNDAHGVFFAPSEFKVSFFDFIDDGTSDGDSLFRLIDGLTLSDVITVTLDFTSDGGYSWNEDFEATKKDCSYKRAERSVEIESKIQVDSDDTIGDVFNANLSDVYTLNSQEGNTRNCSPVNLFIENTMGRAVSYKNYINSSTTFGRFDQDNLPADGDFIPLIIGGGDYDDDGDGNMEDGYITSEGRVSEIDATTILFRLGALDGALIGSMMGYNFFVDRLDTDDAITLTEDDTEELEIKFGSKAYQSIEVMANCDMRSGNADNQWGRWFGVGYGIGDDDGLNSRARQSLALYFYMLEARIGMWSDADLDFDAIDGRILANSSNNVRGKFDEGDRLIYLDDNTAPELVKGDVIAFNTRTEFETENYLIADSGSDWIYLNRPLRVDLPTNTTVYYYSRNDSRGVFQFSAIGGKDSYKNAYGADGENRIELTIYDIDILDPYQSVFLDSSFPDAIAQNYYRASELTYDLMTDNIEMKAYQIG